jgi:hypothetical protein
VRIKPGFNPSDWFQKKRHLETPAFRLGKSNSIKPWPLGLTYWFEYEQIMVKIMDRIVQEMFTREQPGIPAESLMANLGLIQNDESSKIVP